MKNIGLFGGTFNPPHNGHIHIAKAFADELGLDMVVFLPAGNPYHKTGSGQENILQNTEIPDSIPAAAHRLAMTQLAIAADKRFTVSDCDIVREGATYTFDTVQIFRQQFPSARLWWLLGSDSLLNLHTWKHWQALVKQIGIAVAKRADDNLIQIPAELNSWLVSASEQGTLKWLQAAIYAISSTEIRRCLQHNRSVEGLIDSSVENYIRRHNLYCHSL